VALREQQHDDCRYRRKLQARDNPGAATRDFIAAIVDRSGDTSPASACTFEQAWTSVRLIELAFESAAKEGAWLAV
jgi:hypothetical protein